MALVVKNPPANADVRDLGSIPGLGRFHCRVKWQLTLVFLPGKSHEQRSLTGYSSTQSQRSEHDGVTNTFSLFFESKMKQVMSALLSSEHCNENHGHLHTWSQNREHIQIATRLLTSEFHISAHAVLLTRNRKVCAQLCPALCSHAPSSRKRSERTCWERSGCCGCLTQRGQRGQVADTPGWVRRERPANQRQSSWCLCWAGTGIVCQTTPKWAQRNKHVFWNDYMFTLRSSVTLGASFWKWVSLSRAGASKESGCPHRAGAQPVWPQWAAPPAELESEPKPPSRGTSPDHQLPHFTPGFSANL